jgi:hypothetical protein
MTAMKNYDLKKRHSGWLTKPEVADAIFRELLEIAKSFGITEEDIDNILADKKQHEAD